MNFDEFWEKLQDELIQEQEYMTLIQRKEFKAHFEKLIVHVTPKHGISIRKIQSYQFEGIWNNAKGYSRETRFVNKGKRLESYITKKGLIGKSMQLSYICKLIDVVVQDQNMR